MSASYSRTGDLSQRRMASECASRYLHPNCGPMLYFYFCRYQCFWEVPPQQQLYVANMNQYEIRKIKIGYFITNNNTMHINEINYVLFSHKMEKWRNTIHYEGEYLFICLNSMICHKLAYFILSPNRVFLKILRADILPEYHVLNRYFSQSTEVL